jgi:hypothetical protein
LQAEVEMEIRSGNRLVGPTVLRRTSVAGAALLTALCFSVNPKTIAMAGNAASGAAGAGSAGQQIPISLSLNTALDSKKLAVGDKVEAQVASQVELSDGTVIPREAKVTGHVTESKARSKGASESSLGIVFDKIALPSGKTMNIKGYLRAVAPNPNADENGGGVDYGTSMNRTMEHAGPGSESHSVVPILNADSVGVSGLKELELGNDGVLKSGGKSVKLGRGVQMMLRAQVLGVQ